MNKSFFITILAGVIVQIIAHFIIKGLAERYNPVSAVVDKVNNV